MISRNQSCAECAVILRLRHSIPFHSECIFGVWHTPFRGVEWMLQHALHSMEWVCLDTLQAHSSIWIFPPSICLQFARTNACISKVTTLTTFYPPNLLKRENSNTGMWLECVLTHSLHGMECMLLHTFHSMEWNIQCILHSWSVPGMECVPLRNGHKTGSILLIEKCCQSWKFKVYKIPGKFPGKLKFPGKFPFPGKPKIRENLHH